MAVIELAGITVALQILCRTPAGRKQDSELYIVQLPCLNIKIYLQSKVSYNSMLFVNWFFESEEFLRPVSQYVPTMTSQFFQFCSIATINRKIQGWIGFPGEFRHEVYAYTLLNCLSRNSYYGNLQYKLFGGSRQSHTKLLQYGKSPCCFDKSRISIIIFKIGKQTGPLQM